jgi:hypothetical protein
MATTAAPMNRAAAEAALATAEARVAALRAYLAALDEAERTAARRAAYRLAAVHEQCSWCGGDEMPSRPLVHRGADGVLRRTGEWVCSAHPRLVIVCPPEVWQGHQSPEVQAVIAARLAVGPRGRAAGAGYWACYRCNGACTEPDTYCPACQAAIDAAR